MPDPHRPHPLDYLSVPRRPKSKLDRVWDWVFWVVILAGGCLLLFYFGFCVVYVASNVGGDR